MDEHGKPQGSRYDDDHGRRRSRSPWRRFKGVLSRVGVSLAAWIFPSLYMAYCWLVWKTSRVEDGLTGPLRAAADRHGGFVALLWHQEVFTVAYSYRHLHGHTVASTGNFGKIVTRMLERCNFTVFRGGSSKARSRQRRVLLDMIRHMQAEPRVPYGITVDGSKGPAFHMKSGGAVIARACGAPLFVVRSWFSRRITLDTWDRSVIPLPFGRIKSWAVGPYWIAPDCTSAELQQAITHLESELLDLADRSFEAFGQPLPPERQLFPSDWKPLWEPHEEGLRRMSYDLRPDAPPAFARQAR